MDDGDRSAPALDAALEAALLRELRSNYDWENHARFKGRLQPPVITLADAATRLGRWLRAPRTIELSRPLVLTRPWPEVVSVLAHEMAHQYVDEVLHAVGETAHGETFQRLCAAIGVDARAAGAPVPAEHAEGARVLERIRKLLALAGSANQHEAEQAMRRAHELMLRHNVAAAGAQHRAGYQVRHVGDPHKRLDKVQHAIAGLLAELFFVKVIQVPVYLPLAGKRGSTFELVGTHANLEMAVHVFEFLRGTAQRLWQANCAIDARVRSGRDRLSYQAGVIGGFRDKLVAERAALRGTGLVWVGDGDLDRYYRDRHPRITTRSRSVRLDGAHAAGREAGRQIILHKPVAHGPSASAPRLLRN
jgi:predicted SprT family Zn-dependent metalloprotease